MDNTQWVARLTPCAGGVDDVLNAPVTLDVWQRGAQSLVVAASEQDLTELERRRLAVVERIETLAAYLDRHCEPRAREPSKQAD